MPTEGPYLADRPQYDEGIMDIYNLTTIEKFQRAADIFEGWYKDVKSGLYNDKKNEAIVKIRRELSVAAAAWPAIHEAENDPQLGLPVKRSVEPWPGGNLEILKTVFLNHKNDQSAIESHIYFLSREFAGGWGVCFIPEYQSLAVEVRRWVKKIKTIIANRPHTKHPSQPEIHQEPTREIIVNLDKVFERNGRWRKAFVQLVKDEKRDGIKIADSSFFRFKKLLVKKGCLQVADKLNHKGGKMFIDIPHGQIALVSE